MCWEYISLGRGKSKEIDAGTGGGGLDILCLLTHRYALSGMNFKGIWL